jgi:hypothetical protein
MLPVKNCIGQNKPLENLTKCPKKPLSDPGKKQLLSIAFCLGEVIANGFDCHKIGKRDRVFRNLRVVILRKKYWTGLKSRLCRTWPLKKGRG